MPTVKVYNGLIPTMRKSGATLQEIADNCGGISGERIRQILNQYYAGTKVELLRESDLAQIFNCPICHIARLRLSGKITPIKNTSRLIFYSPSQLADIARAVIKHCAKCGKEVEKFKSKYCQECGESYQKNPWPIRSEESKRNSIQASRNWQKEHPERFREITDRAKKKYYQKNRPKYYANQRYIVIGKDTLPIGTIFSATGKQGLYLILPDNTKVSVFKVRKLYPEIKCSSGKVSNAEEETHIAV